MNAEFYSRLAEMKSAQRTFSVATVIAVRGSSSARPGSKAILDETGKNVFGWVGGGCAESFVGRQSVEAVAERRPRIIQADLDDEIFGLGMPCGGVMDVYIEPQLPKEVLSVSEELFRDKKFEFLANSFAFNLKLNKNAASAPIERSESLPSLESLVLKLSSAILHSRGLQLRSLCSNRSIRQVEDEYSELLLIGSGRITEELAKLATLLNWPCRVFGRNLNQSDYPTNIEFTDSVDIRKSSAVVIASHHSSDVDYIVEGLHRGAGYLGMIASQKRAGLIFSYLSEKLPNQRNLAPVHAPCGIELACQNPGEIALSVVTEIILLKPVKEAT